MLPKISLSTVLLTAAVTACSAAEPGFARAPSATNVDGKASISFAVSAKTDVEVAVLDAKGEVVRHLAAGVLGAEKAPPPPLKPGLAQELAWDGRDDFGKTAAGGPFKLRVRLGTGVKFGRLIGANPYAMGRVRGVGTDAEGNAYLMTTSAGTGNFKQVLMLDPEGKYVRTVLPFPANLPPERISAWAGNDGEIHPHNHNALGPEFYTIAGLTLLGSVSEKGLFLTDGRRLFCVAKDGGMVDGKFVHGELWPRKKALPNTGGGPTHLTPSPDGRYLYLSGPYSSNTAYGHKFDPKFPPGQVYRMEVGKGTMQPFAKLPTIGNNPAKAGVGWCSKHISHAGHYTTPHGPVHDVAVTRDGHVLVADQDNQCVAVFDGSGKRVGEIKIGWPDLLAVHPRTGAVYVQTKRIMGYSKFKKEMVKFSGWKDAREVARFDLGVDTHRAPRMSLAAGEKKTVLWISGMRGGVIRLEDRGKEFAIAGDLGEMSKGSLTNADRLEVDRETDTVYINDSWATFKRFDGLTGKGGEVVRLDGGTSATDLAVGPGGLIYAQTGKGYSGPLQRYTRDLKPAPYEESGTHKLSGYIYGRYHGNGGFCEKGMGVSRDGTLYMSWMFGGWVRYAVSAWGPDGKPVNGKGAPVDPNHASRGTPAELKRAIVGPIHGANAGVRTDSRGRIYVGIGVQPKGNPRPAGFEKDASYPRIMGSIIRFGREGGRWGSTRGKGQPAGVKKGAPRPEKPEMFFQPGPMPEGALEANGGNYFVGADMIYPDFGPMSGGHADSGGIGNPGFCHCRVGRFDVDYYDRLYIPSPLRNKVRITDNSDNLICEFGAYGNFDSRYVPEGETGSGPLAETPEVPLGWPVGAGASDRHVYVADMLNRRVVRVDLTWKQEATCALPTVSGATSRAEVRSAPGEADRPAKKATGKAVQTAPEARPAVKPAAKPAEAAASKRRERTPDQICTGWFSAARNYKNVGMKSDARRCLGNIIKAFPDSKWAAQARSEMNGL